MNAVRTSSTAWTVVVPLKVLPNAKSRLATSLSAAQHADLVRAIRADTLAAARRVVRVIVVADAPTPEADLVQHSPGLNGALRDGAAYGIRQWPRDGIVALVGDLPALQPDELAAALVAACEHRRSYIADAAGTGTTFLAVAPGADLDPQFGIDSAARHGTTANRLDAGPGLRCDVDTPEDLEAAAALGLGPATAALCAQWTRNIACSS